MHIHKKYHAKQAYEDLANGIIIQAVKDYREAIEEKNDGEIMALEHFFLSTWYSILTNLPGKVIIEKIRKECGYAGKSF